MTTLTEAQAAIRQPEDSQIVTRLIVADHQVKGMVRVRDGQRWEMNTGLSWAEAQGVATFVDDIIVRTRDEILRKVTELHNEGIR